MRDSIGNGKDGGFSKCIQISFGNHVAPGLAPQHDTCPVRGTFGSEMFSVYIIWS